MRGIRNDSEHNAKQEKKKTAPLIRYLVYFLILTTALTSVSMSRYLAGDTGGDAARIAKLDVYVAPVYPAPMNGLLGPNTDYFAYNSSVGSKTYTFTVTNNSEVAVRARTVAEHEYNPEGTYTVTTSAWVDFAPNNLDGSKNINVTVEKPPLLNRASILMNDVKIYVEYAQID